MYVQFREWLEYRFGESGEPCPAEGQTILEDDGTSHADEESPVGMSFRSNSYSNR